LDRFIEEVNSFFNVCRRFEGDIKGQPLGNKKAEEIPVGAPIA
jgi:hypothetical protein